MIKLKQIRIERAEGPCDLCIERTFDTLDQAQRWINNQRETYPKLGYDKHDVTITWDNGNKFSIRLDCQHPENKYYDGNNIILNVIQSVNSYINHKDEYELKPDDIIFLMAIKNNSYELPTNFNLKFKSKGE